MILPVVTPALNAVSRSRKAIKTKRWALFIRPLPACYRITSAIFESSRAGFASFLLGLLHRSFFQSFFRILLDQVYHHRGQGDKENHAGNPEEFAADQGCNQRIQRR